MPDPAPSEAPCVEPAGGGRLLFLASASPRRRKLLEEAGFAPVVISSGVDDAELCPGARSSPEEWATSLAFLKASAAVAGSAAEGARPIDEKAVVLGADTVVVKGDEVMGKPTDADDARRIVRALAGGEHRVITGVAVVRAGPGGVQVAWRDLLCDAATVRVGPIDAGEIERYVESGAWEGKAGGYNLSERLEAGWPIEFEGDPGTIMGLPMRRLGPMLARLLSGVEVRSRGAVPGGS